MEVRGASEVAENRSSKLTKAKLRPRCLIAPPAGPARRLISDPNFTQNDTYTRPPLICHVASILSRSGMA